MKIQIPAGLTVYLHPVEPPVDAAVEPLFAGQVNRIGLGRMKLYLVAVTIKEEHFRPVLSAIGRAVDAAVGRHEHLLGVEGMDLHSPHAAYRQSGRDQRPGKPLVEGLVEPAALGTCIQDVGLRERLINAVDIHLPGDGAGASLLIRFKRPHAAPQGRVEPPAALRLLQLPVAAGFSRRIRPAYVALLIEPGLHHAAPVAVVLRVYRLFKRMLAVVSIKGLVYRPHLGVVGIHGLCPVGQVPLRYGINLEISGPVLGLQRQAAEAARQCPSKEK